MKRLFAALALACVAALSLAQTPPSSLYTASTPLASAITGTGVQTAVKGLTVPKTYQVTGATSAGTGAATVAVEGSNDGTRFDTVGTVTLSLTTGNASGSFTSSDRYAWLRANISALSGTGAAISVLMGY